MKGKPKNLLKTHDIEVLHNPNSILSSKQDEVTSQCSAPLSSAVEKHVAHEPTQFNVCRDSHLEGAIASRQNAEVSNSVTNVEQVFEGSPDIVVLPNENLSCCWDNVTRMPRSMGKEIILDFEQLAVRMAPSKWDSRRVRLKPRYYRDDRYGCLFQQSGSVETQVNLPIWVTRHILGSTQSGSLTFTPSKRVHYNVSQGMLSSEESPSKRNCLSTPRASNTRLRKFTSATGQCRSSGHIGGVSYEYTDLGDCNQQCHHCDAAFWFGERLKGHSNSRRPEYHLCCRGEKVYMEQNPDPSEYIKHHELENMMHHFGGLDNSNLDLEIVQGLIHFFDTHNELVQLFRKAMGRCREIDILEFKIRLYNGNGARGYEILASNTLGAIVFDNGLTSNMEFDVIIEHRGMPPKRINKLHQSYMSLQFPLLFIHGQSGFHTELKLRRSGGTEEA
ncbi:hypothetical protein Tco_0417607 [Tanacetum coccineum]